MYLYYTKTYGGGSASPSAAVPTTPSASGEKGHLHKKTSSLSFILKVVLIYKWCIKKQNLIVQNNV